MSSEIVRTQAPEARELAKKLVELAALEAQLAERELDLATLQAELHSFETRYLRIVGVRYAELDQIEAQIAEAVAQQNAQDTIAHERATQAHTQAQESAEAVRSAQELEANTGFTPSDRLKKLYREVAKCIHPDLATDPNERARGTQLMAEANRAYEEGDEDRLQAILREWKEGPESVVGEGPGAQLVRVIRKIAQVEERLRTIEVEIARLKESELYQLKTKVEEAEKKGRDLVAEMAAKVDEQITAARERLAGITLKTAEA